jgi:hypothetical protein
MANKGIGYKLAEAMVNQGEKSGAPLPQSVAQPVTSTPIVAIRAHPPPPQSAARTSSATAAPPTPRSAVPSVGRATLTQRIRPAPGAGDRKTDQQPPAAQPGGAKPEAAVSDTAEQQQAVPRAEPVAATPAEAAGGADQGATPDAERKQQVGKLDDLFQRLALCLAGIIECVKAQSVERGTALSGLAKDFLTQLQSQAV